MSLGKPPPSDVRQLDASALKAYAHPLRLRMIRYLGDHGSATATELARHLGESTGQTSYHLRQLARHGLVEDDPTKGTGRERWWKPTSFRVDATQLRDDPDTAPAARAMMDAVVQGRAETMQDWVLASAAAPMEWVEASVHSQSTMSLTAAETAELVTALSGVLDEFAARAEGREDDGGPAGSERVRVYVDVFPLLPGAPGG